MPPDRRSLRFSSRWCGVIVAAKRSSRFLAFSTFSRIGCAQSSALFLSLALSQCSRTKSTDVLVVMCSRVIRRDGKRVIRADRCRSTKISSRSKMSDSSDAISP